MCKDKSKLFRFTMCVLATTLVMVTSCVESISPVEQKVSIQEPPDINISKAVNEECCPNGDLEYGEQNPTGWTAYTGGCMNNPDFDENDLEEDDDWTSCAAWVRSSDDGYDSIVGGTTLPLVAEGNYSLMLGNTMAFAEVDAVCYTFEVTECNKIFTFMYALVFEWAEGFHVWDGQYYAGYEPFFRYYVKKGTTPYNRWWNPFDNVIEGIDVTIDASVDDPLFEAVPGKDYMYKQWTCVSLDLSDHVGKTRTIVFIVGDCALGDHCGYAYIDGLCEVSDATASFSMDDVHIIYSGGDDLIVDGSDSKMETSYFWSIEESDANWGRNPDTEVSEHFTGYAGQMNLTEWYNSKGKQFECDAYYRIKLAVSAECTPWNEQTKVLYVSCAPDCDAIASFSMPDVICRGDDLIADGSASTHETSHWWGIEKTDENWGHYPETVAYQWFHGQPAGQINLTEFYNSHGKQFECDAYYRIKLAVSSDCTPWNEQTKVLYVSCPSVTAGDDLWVNCKSAYTSSVQLGIGNSPTQYEYVWSPSTGLDNPYSASPFHHFGGPPMDGPVNYPITYTVTATDEHGCTATDSVTIRCGSPPPP